MADNDRFASIADASKPNAGRIYDFALGGNHNFEVDRQAAQGIFQLLPSFTKSARTVRWFLGEAVRRLLADGFTQFIDFASGLPTVDHIHEIAPKGTKVVYSDIDPVTVAYGREILKDDPDARYIICNVATPEHLLEDSAIMQFLDKSRKTAIGINGVAWFVKDEDLRHSLHVLYDWADKGFRLYISDVDFNPSKSTASREEMSKIYEKLEQPFYIRPLEALLELCRPWKVREPGFQPLEDWIKLRAGVGEKELSTLGGFCKGAILEK